MKFNVQNYSYSLPWFMFDITNGQLITSKHAPLDIVDSKEVFLTETPIPGLNYSPIQQSGNGNRKVSFTLPLLRKNNTIGNSPLLKQFAILRNQSSGILNILSESFTPNPKVLYYWGLGSVPLIYYIKKCDFTNKHQWVNQIGQPQYSEVSMELWLDESNKLYKAEEIFRNLFSQSSLAIEAFDFFVP